MNWPPRGVYFFFKAGETRSGSGEGRRVVRIGTHALTDGSRSTLWGRLSQHRGVEGGGGNHRDQIFRLLVGVALARQGVTKLPESWGVGADAGTAARRLGIDRSDVRTAEADLELRVSRYVGGMPLLWLDIGDEPGPSSERALVERNAIALLSSSREQASDPASTTWLGAFGDRGTGTAFGPVEQPACGRALLPVFPRRRGEVYEPDETRGVVRMLRFGSRGDVYKGLPP